MACGSKPLPAWGNKEGLQQGPVYIPLPQSGSRQGGPLTCGGVGVDEVLAPDMISSVMSLPPWLGSRIRICPRVRAEKGKLSEGLGTKHMGHPLSLGPTPTGHPLLREERLIQRCACPGHMQPGDPRVPPPLPTGHSAPQTPACPNAQWTGTERGTASLASHRARQSEPAPCPQASACLRGSGHPKASLRWHRGCGDPPPTSGTAEGTGLAMQKSRRAHTPAVSLWLPWVQQKPQGTLLGIEWGTHMGLGLRWGAQCSQGSCPPHPQT